MFGVLVVVLSVLRGVVGQGFRRSPLKTELVLSPRMHEILTPAELPPELDWRWKDGQNYTTANRNQHIPKYCGACYAFGSVTSLADRIRVARGPAGREVVLAVQVVLNCDTADFGCSGGDPIEVYRFIAESGGIPEETCQPYEAVGHDTGRTCEAKDVCEQCDDAACSAQHEYNVYGILEYGLVRGEFEMMAELQRGPIACQISTPTGFLELAGYGVFTDPSHDTAVDHIISVVGYGIEGGVHYWVIRNSWGTYWGHYGWARIARGTNTIQIETECAWATPSHGGLPQPRHSRGPAPVTAAVRSAEAAQTRRGPIAEASPRSAPAARPCRVQRSGWAAAGGERVLSPRPHEVVPADSLPPAWDWRNVSGTSFASSNTNERLPRGTCASCWAQGVASALADRIAVQRGGRWPQVGLSPQVLINCQGGGSCQGGDPAGAYAFIHGHGITDDTCQNYRAEDLPCDGAGVCMNCAPGGEHGLVWPGHCVAVRRPIIWSVSEYGSVRGAAAMKPEIYQRGPIGCGLESTERFRRYRGGVFSEATRRPPRLDHQVSLAGWGLAGPGELVPRGTELWVGRNSFGSDWGEGGWFRLRMHRDNLGVELDCDWGVPTEGRPGAPALITAAMDGGPGAATGVRRLALGSAALCLSGLLALGLWGRRWPCGPARPGGAGEAYVRLA